MKNGVYGIAGVCPDRTKNDRVIDSEKKYLNNQPQ